MKSRIWRDPFSAADRRWRYIVRIPLRTGLYVAAGTAPTWAQAFGRVNALHHARRVVR